MAFKNHLPHDLCVHLQNVSRAAIHHTPVPYTNQSVAIASILLRHGLVTNVTRGTPTAPNPAKFLAMSPADKRLWITMKYRNGLPVLRRVSHVSKSSFRVHVTRDELGRLLSGKRARNTAGIGMGEILIVKTPDDPTIGRVGIAAYMDGWQAWRAGLGGEVMVRAA